MKFLKKLLDTLPFSGDKLKISGWLALLAALQNYTQDIDFTSLIAFLASHPTPAAAATFIIALLHRYLKKKYPEGEPAVKNATGNVNQY